LLKVSADEFEKREADLEGRVRLLELELRSLRNKASPRESDGEAPPTPEITSTPTTTTTTTATTTTTSSNISHSGKWEALKRERDKLKEEEERDRMQKELVAGWAEIEESFAEGEKEEREEEDMNGMEEGEEERAEGEDMPTDGGMDMSNGAGGGGGGEREGITESQERIGAPKNSSPSPTDFVGTTFSPPERSLDPGSSHKRGREALEGDNKHAKTKDLERKREEKKRREADD